MTSVYPKVIVEDYIDADWYTDPNKGTHLVLYDPSAWDWILPVFSTLKTVEVKYLRIINDTTDTITSGVDSSLGPSDGFKVRLPAGTTWEGKFKLKVQGQLQWYNPGAMDIIVLKLPVYNIAKNKAVITKNIASSYEKKEYVCDFNPRTYYGVNVSDGETGWVYVDLGDVYNDITLHFRFAHRVINGTGSVTTYLVYSSDCNVFSVITSYTTTSTTFGEVTYRSAKLNNVRCFGLRIIPSGDDAEVRIYELIAFKEI